MIQTDPALLVELAECFNDLRPSTRSDPEVDRLPVLSREGPFHAEHDPAVTGDHPMIITGGTGCPYRMTSYHMEDLAPVNSAFGVHVHPPIFWNVWGAGVGPVIESAIGGVAEHYRCSCSGTRA